jgi:GDSL-like Lipase/Acylhydrolase family
MVLLILGTAAGLAAAEFGSRILAARRSHYLDTITPYHTFFERDPLVGHVHRPNAAMTIKRPDHPAGTIEMRTNNLGLRSDHDTAPVKPPGRYRILVLGDSHTEGYCFNRETYPAILEALLRKRFPERDIEVLNAGVAYYSPQQDYLHAMQLLSLRPDLIVVGLYAGNDLLDQVRDAANVSIPLLIDWWYLMLWQNSQLFRSLQGVFQKIQDRTDARPAEYAAALKRGSDVNGPAVWQALNQALYFHYFPAEMPAAEIRVQRALAALKRLCEGSCEVLAFVIPAKVSAEWDADATTLESLGRLMGLDPDALRLDALVAIDFARLAREAGLPALSLATPCPTTECYYKSDYHLNPDGNRLAASGLATWIAGTMQRARQ